MSIAPFYPTVVSLCRYPVKSMMGEELNAITITENGCIGDRAYALVDIETGRVVSAKNPKKWPDMFSFRASYIDFPRFGYEIPPVWITLPSGEVMRSDDAQLDERLSSAMARKVQIQKQAPSSPALEQYWPEREGEAEDITNESIAGAAPEGTFFDYATLHILTTGTLNRLRESYPSGRFESRRFRPNLVIETDPSIVDFVENTWVGKTLKIGEVLLAITDPCPRCVMPTLAQGDLPKDPGIQKAMMANTVHVPFVDRPLPSVGVYARVIRGGVIHRQERVEIG